MHVGVAEVGTNLCELASVKEAVSAGEKVGCGDEILDSGDDGFSIAGCDEVMFDVHQFEGLCACFFGLWYVYSSA